MVFEKKLGIRIPLPHKLAINIFIFQPKTKKITMRNDYDDDVDDNIVATKSVYWTEYNS